MRVAAALLCAAAGRALTLRGGGLRVGADPEGPAEDDPDDIELRGWLSPEGMAAVDRGAAERQAALAASLQRMGPLLTSRKAAGGPMQISAVCSQFHVPPDACDRVEQYLGHIGHSNSTRVTVKVGGYFSDMTKADVLFAISLGDLCMRRSTTSAAIYKSDFCKIMQAASTPIARNLADQHALFKFGDRMAASPCYPTFYKARFISRRDGNYILADWNRARHWGAVDEVRRLDSAFTSKQSRLVWRGVSTGKCNASSPNSRMMLCKKWSHTSSNVIDVGFNEIVQGCSAAAKYMKPTLSMLQMLQYKYILVVNGNDKATGLNWALAANSVPFMVKPDVESWLLESNLEAWKHYVPLKPDFSDLSQQVDWAKNNNRAAADIARAGKAFMKQFGPEAKETQVEAAVLTAYLDRVAFAAGGGGGSLEGRCQNDS